MPKLQKRDRDYFERRLRDEFPTISAGLKAGKYKTINEAAKVAGLVNPACPLNTLKSAWTKASPTERREFLAWVSSRTAPGRKTLPKTPSKAMVNADFYVMEWAKAES
ncbi:MAG: hypothetical protein E5Y04_32070 [Mesorhizobium sp.]|nr:MAG: hypothetical protein E5Y04_32070 [Mesorhizobium sp.]